MLNKKGTIDNQTLKNITDKVSKFRNIIDNFLYSIFSAFKVIFQNANKCLKR